MKNLRATLIDVSRYTEIEEEQYINNICQKIILYGEKYTSLRSNLSDIEIDDDTTHTTFNTSFPIRRVLKKRHINTNTVHYELELYEREPLEEFESDNDDGKIMEYY